MVKGEGLEVLQERMRALDPDKNDLHKFLGCEQAEKIDKNKVRERTVREMERRMRSLTESELYDKNLVKTKNTRIIPAGGYVMNVCRFNKNDLVEMGMVIKRELRRKLMH